MQDNRSGHIIRQQVLEVHTSHIVQGIALQDKLSKLSQDAIPDILESSIDQYISREHITSLETVTLDLGNISQENFETEFIQRLKEAADAYFKEYKYSFNTDPQQTSLSEKKRNLLFYFLLHGHLPWWFSSSQVFNPQELLRTMLREFPALLVHFLQKEGNRSWVRKRLAAQFPEPEIKQLIRTLAPSDAVIIFQYTKEITRIQDAKKHIPAPGKQFREVIWEFILHYLLMEKSSRFEEKNFLKSILRQMASRFNLDYTTLLFEFGEATYVSTEPDGGILALLREIYLEETQALHLQDNITRRSPEGLVPADPAHFARTASLFGYFLQNGSLHTQVSHYEHKTFTEMLLTAFRLNTREMLRILFREGKHERSRYILVTAFPASFLRKITGWIEPAHAPMIHRTADLLDKIHTNSSTTILHKAPPHMPWQIIFSFLLTQRGTRFNQKSYLRYLLRSTAAHYNLAYDQLLEFLAESAEKPGYIFENLSVSMMILELKAEDGITREVRETMPAAAFAWPKNAAIDFLLYYLEYEKMPWWAKPGMFSSPPVLLKTLLSSYPQQLMEALSRHISATVLFRRLALLMNPVIFKRFLSQTSWQPYRYILEMYKQAEQKLSHTTESQSLEAFRTLILAFLLTGYANKTVTQSLFQRWLAEIAHTYGWKTETLYARMKRLALIIPASYAHIFNHYLFLASAPVKTTPSPLKEPEGPETMHTMLAATEELLRTGFLPSWATRFKNYTPEALLAAVATEYPEAFRIMMQRLFGQSFIRHKIVAGFSLPLLVQTGLFVYPDSFSQVHKFAGTAKKLIKALYPKGNPEELHVLFWTTGFHYLSSYTNFRVKDFLERLLDHITVYTKIKPTVLLKKLEKTLKKNEENLGPEVLAAVYFLVKEQKPTEKTVPESQEDPEIQEGGFYIDNAGMILFWPFLKAYFERLGMLEGNQFTDAENAARAVHLLQYLVTGNATSPEHLLVLNKLLCGIPLHTPVPAAITILEEEAETSESMLKALIAQWSTLGNTSIEGLREAFIQRKGKLIQEEQVYRLIIEKRSIDILLSSLPWQINMIKLPWMHQILYISWS